VTSPGKFFTFTGLTGGTFYRFQVAAINTVGQGAWSEQIGFYAAIPPSVC